jgi:type IV pilus assembly protein PilV
MPVYQKGDKQMACGSKPYQQGFSLLEVMISGAILSSGLAGLAALLLASVSGTAQTGHLTTASLLADSLAAQMVSSPSVKSVYLQEPPELTRQCNAQNSCTAEQYAAANLKSWHLELSSRLPEGEGHVCRDSSPFDGTTGQPRCDGSDHLVIKVFWQPGARLGQTVARVVKRVD